MIKSDIIDELYRVLGGTNKRDIAKYVDFIFAALSDALINEESVKIAKFGVFETRHKNARMGRNPRTMEEAEISARRVVSFRTSEQLQKRMNSEEAYRAIENRKKSLEDQTNKDKNK